MSGVDNVAIKMAAGYNVIKPDAWQALPKAERFELVKAHRVVFMCQGKSVPVRDALAYLGSHGTAGLS